MIRMDLLNVGLVEETGGILLVLRAPERHRLLVIETGIAEGSAIALEASGVRSDRPMTHDLLHHVIERLGARLESVHIQDFADETYYAKLVLIRSLDGGRREEIDARPSDAIALALRAKVPIFATEEVLTKMGEDEDRLGRFAELFEDGEEEEADEEDGDGTEKILH